jgi:hypothetical protein
VRRGGVEGVVAGLGDRKSQPWLMYGVWFVIYVVGLDYSFEIKIGRTRQVCCNYLTQCILVFHYSVCLKWTVPTRGNHSYAAYEA